MRVGLGYDLHRLEAGEDLILGGIKIEFELGLRGHSDADVLIHALIDALLGAMGKGDIGELFPDSDPAYSGISSLDLLDVVVKMMDDEGNYLINADIVVMAQAPKIMPYKPLILRKLSRHLQTKKSRLNLKATTTENLGVIGKKQAIASQAVVLIEEGENHVS